MRSDEWYVCRLSQYNSTIPWSEVWTLLLLLCFKWNSSRFSRYNDETSIIFLDLRVKVFRVIYLQYVFVEYKSVTYLPGALSFPVSWLVAVSIAHLEGLQVLSNMSQHNVREALSQLECETRRHVETHLANVEASFDLGYLQTEDG